LIGDKRDRTTDCGIAKRALDLSRLGDLPIEYRLKAVEELWDSIAAEDPDLAVPLTPALLAELDRRLEEHRVDPTSVVPWEQVRAELVVTLRRP
jgi:putative addiction module component (TIGR02574 family)